MSVVTQEDVIREYANTRFPRSSDQSGRMISWSTFMYIVRVACTKFAVAHWYAALVLVTLLSRPSRRRALFRFFHPGEPGYHRFGHHRHPETGFEENLRASRIK